MEVHPGYQAFRAIQIILSVICLALALYQLNVTSTFLCFRGGHGEGMAVASLKMWVHRFNLIFAILLIVSGVDPEGAFGVYSHQTAETLNLLVRSLVSVMVIEYAYAVVLTKNKVHLKEGVHPLVRKVFLFWRYFTVFVFVLTPILYSTVKGSIRITNIFNYTYGAIFGLVLAITMYLSVRMIIKALQESCDGLDLNPKSEATSEFVMNREKDLKRLRYIMYLWVTIGVILFIIQLQALVSTIKAENGVNLFEHFDASEFDFGRARGSLVWPIVNLGFIWMGWVSNENAGSRTASAETPMREKRLRDSQKCSVGGDTDAGLDSPKSQTKLVDDSQMYQV